MCVSFKESTNNIVIQGTNWIFNLCTGILLTILFVILFLIVLILRKRILIATQMIKEASK